MVTGEQSQAPPPPGNKDSLRSSEPQSESFIVKAAKVSKKRYLDNFRREKETDFDKTDVEILAKRADGVIQGVIGGYEENNIRTFEEFANAVEKLTPEGKPIFAEREAAAAQIAHWQKQNPQVSLVDMRRLMLQVRHISDYLRDHPNLADHLYLEKHLPVVDVGPGVQKDIPKRSEFVQSIVDTQPKPVEDKKPEPPAKLTAREKLLKLLNSNHAKEAVTVIEDNTPKPGTPIEQLAEDILESMVNSYLDQTISNDFQRDLDAQVAGFKMKYDSQNKKIENDRIFNAEKAAYKNALNRDKYEFLDHELSAEIEDSLARAPANPNIVIEHSGSFFPVTIIKVRLPGGVVEALRIYDLPDSVKSSTSGYNTVAITFDDSDEVMSILKASGLNADVYTPDRMKRKAEEEADLIRMMDS